MDGRFYLDKVLGKNVYCLTLFFLAIQKLRQLPSFPLFLACLGHYMGFNAWCRPWFNPTSHLVVNHTIAGLPDKVVMQASS